MDDPRNQQTRNTNDYPWFLLYPWCKCRGSPLPKKLVPSEIVTKEFHICACTCNRPKLSFNKEI